MFIISYRTKTQVLTKRWFFTFYFEGNLKVIGESKGFVIRNDELWLFSTSKWRRNRRIKLILKWWRKYRRTQQFQSHKPKNPFHYRMKKGFSTNVFELSGFYQHKRRFAIEWWGFANNCHWYFHRSVLKVDKLVKGGKFQVVAQYFDKHCFKSHPLSRCGLWLICWLWELTGQRVLVGQTNGQSLFFMTFKFIAIWLLGQCSWRRLIPIKKIQQKKTATPHEVSK